MSLKRDDAMRTPEEWADMLVAFVSTVTQLDTEKGELQNADDWRRNAVALFRRAIDCNRDAAINETKAGRAALRGDK